MKTISILGSTGSIGTQALDFVSDHPDKFIVKSLSAKKNWKLLLKQIQKFKPEAVAIEDEDSCLKLKKELKNKKIKVYCGKYSSKHLAKDIKTQLTLTAFVGISGLLPTIEAIKNGSDIALANKETLVTGGRLVMELAKKHKIEIIPVDSEHSAIFQCLQGEKLSDIKNIILTSSGGPFKHWSKKRMKKITRQDALNHPTWNMGAKITIDSATLMNKGFEVIEAHWLFGVKPDMIKVVIHPESIVHSLVEFIDSSQLAQLGIPDMKVPISYALGYPERLSTKVKSLDLTKLKSLNFNKPDLTRFPCLQMAYESLISGDSYCVVLNAANEAAVDLFLMNKIRFNDISGIIKKELKKHIKIKSPDIDCIIELDLEVKRRIYGSY